MRVTRALLSLKYQLAEKMFWGNTKFADIPFMGGVEIIAMKPEEVQRAVEALLRLSVGATKV